MPTEGKSTVMNVKEYPELEGLEVGAAVRGSWEGSVSAVDGDDMTIAYDTVNIETENDADRELNKLQGKKKMPMMPAPMMEGEEE